MTKETPPRDEKGRFIKGLHYSRETEFKKGTHWRKPKPYWNKDWLWEEYVVKGKSAKQIADEQGCKENNILYFLDKFKIPRRTMSEIRAKKYWGIWGKRNGMYGKRGELCPRWQGGCSPFRQKMYGRAEWKEIVKEVLKRDGYRCQICGAGHTYKNRLVVHHILPVSCFPEYISEMWNLATLCEKCHKKIHKAKFFRIDTPEQLGELIASGKFK